MEGCPHVIRLVSSSPEDGVEGCLHVISLVSSCPEDGVEGCPQCNKSCF